MWRNYIRFGRCRHLFSRVTSSKRLLLRLWTSVMTSPSSEETLPYPDKTITTPKASMSRPVVPVSFMTQTVIAEKPTPPMPLKTTTNIIRSTSQPLMPSPASARSLMRPPATRISSILSTSSSGSLARNKGVQMVSEMRARVRNLEKKIHTHVPRKRKG